MSVQGQFMFEETGANAELLKKLFEKSDRILVKKLSNNDRDWADNPSKHQAGFYVPVDQRDGGFFPLMELKVRTDGKTDEIWERYFTTFWPQTGEEKLSRLVNYRSKGQETHVTGVPKPAFAGLLPASFLLIGRYRRGDNTLYECITIDSGSDEALLLAELFDIGPDFLIGEFQPAERKAHERERILDFAELVIAAWLGGTIDRFAADNAVMPPTLDLARLAQAAFMKKRGIERIDPFALATPGDDLREISRSIEWDLFREYQRRERAVEIVRLVLGDAPKEYNASQVIRRLIDELPAIDAVMLSASQQRKSRAGYSYEHHIEAMLLGGNIPFEKQVVIEAKKRPDFILPSLKFIDGGDEKSGTGLILSAKTTLRERWKQVEREKGSRALYLTTVDENIAGNAIDDMATMGIHLVVPESLKKSDETEYAGHSNVVTFAEFCADVVTPRLAVWRS